MFHSPSKPAAAATEVVAGIAISDRMLLAITTLRKCPMMCPCGLNAGIVTRRYARECDQNHAAGDANDLGSNRLRWRNDGWSARRLAGNAKAPPWWRGLGRLR